jgi:predicted nuclease of predicted toxin-antitoxin system
MAVENKRWHFLIDANLPPRLCESFRAHGYTAAHIQDLGMEHAADIEIWKRGHLEQAVIVTKDKDFASLAIIRSDLCPVIFVRLGNLRRGPLLAKFESVMQNLMQALNNGDKIIEIA